MEARPEPVTAPVTRINPATRTSPATRTNIELARTRQSYRHEAYLWSGPSEFTSGLVSFVEEGLDADEPILVAVSPLHGEWLQKALGRLSSHVAFVDLARSGGNPARLIPLWQAFLDAREDRLQPARGVGEAVWPGQRPAERVECQLHEALLNVAIDPDLPLWLICPYEVDSLSPELADDVSRSHPAIADPMGYRGSVSYGGREHAGSMFAADLPAPAGPPVTARFSDDNLRVLARYLTLELYVAGLSSGQAARLASVAHQLAAGSLSRGAVGGTVSIWCEPGAVICELTDPTRMNDALAGRSSPINGENPGLWGANQLCDLVQLRSGLSGTQVRLHTWTR